MNGQIPTARVAPILSMLIEERWPARKRPDGEEWGTTILAEKVGCHPGAIDSIIAQKNEGAEFNLVDQILCSLGRPDFWWGTLSDLYYSADLRENPRGYIPVGYQRCERVGCANVFKPHPKAPKSGLNKPRFCSPACNDATYRTRRRGGFKRGAYGPGMRLRSMVCAQGHDLTPDNIAPRKDGKKVCLACQRERGRVWVKNKRAKQREAALAAR